MFRVLPRYFKVGHHFGSLLLIFPKKAVNRLRLTIIRP
jgi:hypothetical protein